MANTLTGLIPVMYAAMNRTSRERIGLIGAVSRDPTAEAAAVDQTVRSPVVGAMAAQDITPSNVSATGTDQTIEYVDVVITKQRKVPFHLTGEQEKGLGPNNVPIAQQRFEQAFRTLGNEIESDLTALYYNASRAYGTAGTTPFGTGDDLTDASEVMRILDDNGAPGIDRHLVIGSAATAKLLGKQPSVFRVNEAGEAMGRRFGSLQDLFGFEFHHSGQIKQHTAGAGTGYLANGGEPIGETAMVLDTGSGTILQGDVVTFAGDSNKYIVKEDGTTVLATLNKPGLRETLADNAAMTIGAGYTANMALTRDAIQLAARVPAVPTGGDNADDRMYITDPISGLVFEITVYRQYRQVTFEVAICWGVKAIKPEHMALLLG